MTDQETIELIMSGDAGDWEMKVGNDMTVRLRHRNGECLFFYVTCKTLIIRRTVGPPVVQVVGLDHYLSGRLMSLFPESLPVFLS